jgi:hypothetical protein
MGLTPYDGKDDVDYHAFKAIEARDPQKYVVLRQLREDGFPYFNPYA